MTEPTHEKPECRLLGEDSNVFNLLGIAARTLRDAGQPDRATELTNRAFACGSYPEVLALLDEYVEVV